MRYDKAMRDRISKEATGKVVASLVWTDADGGYWTMTFADGSEVSFRFMAELAEPNPMQIFNCKCYNNGNGITLEEARARACRSE